MELQERWAPKVKLGLKVPLAHKAKLVPQVLRESQEQRVHRVLLALKAQLA